MAAKAGDNKNVNAPETADKPADSGPVDIDKMNVTLLIVCKKKESFENAANYLMRRGWKAAVTADVMGAFKQIGTLKPDFVLLSVNLPTPKIGQLPALVTNTFNVPVITFGEGTDVKTQRLLQDVRASYTMQGQISGPGAHRRIKTILQDMYRTEEDIARRPNSRAQNSGEETTQTIRGKALTNDEGAVQIKGQERGSDGGIIIAKGQAPSKGSSRFSKDAGLAKTAEEESSPEEQARQQKVIERAQQELQNLLKDAGVEKDEVDVAPEIEMGGAEESGGADQIEKRAGQEHSFTKKQESPFGDGDHGNHTQAQDASTGSGTAHGLFDAEASLGAGQEAERPSSPKDDANGGEEIGTITTRKAMPGRKAAGQLGDLQVGRAGQGIVVGQAGAVKATQDLGQSKTAEEANLENIIMHSATAAALGPEEPVSVLNVADHCTLWPVSHGKFTGLLLVAHGGSLVDEDAFATMFIDYFKNQGRRQRQKVEILDYISTRLESVNLNEAVEGEVFTKKIRSGRSEIIIKLIEVKNQKMNLVSEKIDNKVRITSQNLFADLSPGASLYLHMPTNEKFFLYLKEKSVLSAKQHEKLETTKTNLYLDTQDIELFKQTYSRNAVVQKIRDMKKTSKKSA